MTELNILMLVAFGLAGGLLRVLLSYSRLFQFRVPFDVDRAEFSLLVGALSGGLAAPLASSIISVVAPALPLLPVAIIAGFGGPDTFEAAWRGVAKKLGGTGGSMGSAAGPWGTKAGTIGATLPSYYGENLNDRQLAAIEFVRKRGRITNNQHQKIAAVSDATASHDLAALVKLEILLAKGRGKGTFYVLK